MSADLAEVWLLRPSNASGWELWPPGTHNGIEGFQRACHRMIALTDEEVAPAAGPSGSLGGPGLSEAEQQAYDEAQGWVSYVAGALAAGDPVMYPVTASDEREAKVVAKLLSALDRLAAPPVSREEGGEGLAEALVHASLDACANVPYDQKGDCLTWWSEDPRSWCASCTIVAYLARAALDEPAEDDNEATEWVECGGGSDSVWFRKTYGGRNGYRLTVDMAGWTHLWIPVADWNEEEDGPVPDRRRRFAVPPSASPPERQEGE